MKLRRVILRAKLRKAAGLDNIPAEVLRNPVCVDLLYKIIRHCFNMGTVPRDWNNGLIKPIPKSDGKDPRDRLRYTGITLISIPCKIYADILNIRLSKWIEDNDYLVEEQNGFRRNKSCKEHIYSLDSVVEFFSLLLPVLWTLKRRLTLLIETVCGTNYDNVKCAVKVNDVITPFLDVILGVKQGCKLSSTLFAIYIHDLAEEIKSLNCGLEIHCQSTCSNRRIITANVK